VLWRHDIYFQLRRKVEAHRRVEGERVDNPPSSIRKGRILQSHLRRKRKNTGGEESEGGTTAALSALSAKDCLISAFEAREGGGRGKKKGK